MLSKLKYLLFVSFLFFLIPGSIFAQLYPSSSDKSYEYESFLTTINVNKNASFDVEERQTFVFNGQFHQAFRQIPINKFDSLSNISVIDGSSQQPLVYSREKLNKLDPESWGKYTFYKENGSYYIEWYYNLADTTKTWIIKYQVHGGVTFGKEQDRLYWNIFSGFSVPIRNAEATFIYPPEISIGNSPAFAYRTNSNYEILKQQTPNSIIFSSDNFNPNEAFTIDAFFPKGYINRISYWSDFVLGYLIGVSSFILILATILSIVFLWYIREKQPQDERAIVPQYKPPENLRPAIAEVIAKERISEKGFAATIIDLAVKGYIKIEEDKSSNLIRIVKIIINIVALIFIAFIFLISTNWLSKFNFLTLLIYGIFLIVFVHALYRNIKQKSADYTLKLLKYYDNDPKLVDYEKAYLALLFYEQNKFSTKELRDSDQMAKQAFKENMDRLTKEIIKEADVETKSYEVNIQQEKKLGWGVWGVVIIVITLIFVFRIDFNDITFLLITIALCSLIFFLYIRYEARLNQRGVKLKQDWMGFKLYLEVAEKYRMQNLTPELFEKYLPYAIILGVEKKWAKAFDSLNINSPTWYGSPAFSSGSYASGGSAGFSPSAFSSSFSSSFTSSFASSGASGGVGGGGGAGGGGGGGGGGAS